tara:strand:+ start:1598 stop:2110 length:513 start_codon:yes stop_codon:yes gene_type:complete
MQTKYTQTSSTSVSFSYSVNGQTKSGSYSISPALLHLLASVKECSYESAKLACSQEAKKFKESGVSKGLTDLVKLYVYSQLINDNLLIGYKYSTSKESKTCAFYNEEKERKTTRVEVPSIIFYALKSRFSNPNYEVSCSYQKVRDSFQDCKDVNFEESMRLYLLNLLIKK